MRPSFLLTPLHDRPVLTLGLLAAAGFMLLFAGVEELCLRVEQEASRQYASVLTRTLDQARVFYASDVTSRVEGSGVEVTHRYLESPGDIPNPATFTIELAERVSALDMGVMARLYSDYPFPDRERGGPRSVFEEEALVAARRAPETPFWSVLPVDGEASLHYALPIRMSEACVACHNEHPQSPRKDWKVGDVRGVQSVVLPLGLSADLMHDGVLKLFGMTTAMLFLGIGMLGVVVGRLRETVAAERAARVEVEAAMDELQQTYTAVDRFVPHAFLDVIGRPTIRDVDPGDSSAAEMEVLFCDMRGFTTLIEGLSPTEAYAFINDFMAVMETPIHEAGGFVNQYLGDAIMALFPTGADAALTAAGRMALALDAHNAARAERGEAPISAGIGLSAGPLVLGTIGSGSRLANGVVGDDVNLAARLESLTPVYGARVLVSGRCWDRAEARSVTAREIDRIRVKGKQEAVRVYELLDAVQEPERGRMLETLDVFERARRRYEEGDFESARVALSECVRRVPSDHVARFLLERCEGLCAAPPSDWDGTWTFRRK